MTAGQVRYDDKLSKENRVLCFGAANIDMARAPEHKTLFSFDNLSSYLTWPAVTITLSLLPQASIPLKRWRLLKQTSENTLGGVDS